MRIQNIRAIQPATPGSPPDWRTSLGQILVRIDTDKGMFGIGVGAGGKAGIHVVESVLRELLVGKDPTDDESLHEAMNRHTVLYGRGALVQMAISGVDLALWDLRGRVFDQPVARLLNPGVDLERGLPTYATVFDDDAAEQAIASGCSAIKLHVERFGAPPDVARLARLVQQTRQRLGEEARIMIDAFANWDVESALKVAQVIEPYRVEWLEEPLPPDDEGGYERLRDESPVALAAGEHEYGLPAFQHQVRSQCLTVLQPDINWCGGMTTMVEIYRMVETQRAVSPRLRVCPHRGAEPFALHVIAALDPHPLAESPRSWFRCLRGAAEIEEGVIRCPDRAGFGIETDESLWK